MADKQIEYWWEIKRYKDEPILISERAAQTAIQALDAGSEFITVNGTTLNRNAISGVEKSSQRIPQDNIYLIAEEASALMMPYGKGEPFFAPDYEENGIKYSGGVLWNWYRRNIDRREWEKYYAPRHYYRIDHPDNSIWVASRLVLYKNCEIPIEWVLCTKEEMRMLDAKLGTQLQ